MTAKHALRCCLFFSCVLLLALAAGCGNHNRHSDGFTSSGGSKSNARLLVSGLPNFTNLVKQVSPAVVNISAFSPPAAAPAPSAPDDSGPGPNSEPNDGSQGPDNNALRDFLKRFFGDGSDAPPVSGPPTQPNAGPMESLGSGFIISSNGYILTNRHVIEGADKIVVKLGDHRQLLAHVVGSDADSDIALLKVKANNLPTVSIGNSDRLQVGAWVVAIGSPFGFDTSVTAGIVSAMHRDLADSRYVSFIQTDVPVNPGNSGGPLFNLAGQVVGINSQIYSQSGGFEGVSFAIPINLAMHVAEQLKDHGEVKRGWLGVQVQDIDREMAGAFDLSRPVGALVTQVFKHSPAAAAGLKVGDVIQSFDGQSVDSADDLPPLVGALSPGSKVDMTVVRHGHQKMLAVTIKPLPAQFDEDGNPQAGNPTQQRFGMNLAPLTKADRKKESMPAKGGVLVTAVAPSGPAANAGLAAGDVILSVGGQRVDAPAAAFHALEKSHGSAALLVSRHGTQRFLVIDTSKAKDKASN